MTKDRLPALHAARRFNDLDDDFPAEGALDYGYRLLMECEYLQDFLAQVTEVRADVKRIEELTKEVRMIHSAILSAPVIDQKIRLQLEEKMASIKEVADKVQVKLKIFELDAQREEKTNKTSAELRIRKIQHATLSRIFVEVMSEYNSTQVDYRERCKKRFLRQLELTGKRTTDAELESMLEQDNPTIFTQDIKFADLEEAQKSLDDIKARHADIMQLEKSIIELHSMFMNMSMLVDKQGDLVDQIEYNVLNALEYVQDGNKTMKKALVYQSRARRKTVVIVAIVLIVLTILVAVIVSAIRKK